MTHGPAWARQHHQSPQVTSGLTRGAVRPVGLDKWTKTCVCHDSTHIEQFAASKSSVLCLSMSPSPALATTDLPVVSIGLPFPEHLVAGITWHSMQPFRTGFFHFFLLYVYG